MGLYWTKTQLDNFGQRVRKLTDTQLEARHVGDLVGNIVQSGGNVNPVVTIETKRGTQSFQIDFSPENLEASDERLREKIRRELDRIGV